MEQDVRWRRTEKLAGCEEEGVLRRSREEKGEKERAGEMGTARRLEAGMSRWLVEKQWTG
jgi:hypothetical protein